MPRADRVKASTALALRVSGADWAAVAQGAGYATRDSARVAVRREEQRRAEEAQARSVFRG